MSLEGLVRSRSRDAKAMWSRDVGHDQPALEPERWRRHLWTGFLILPRWAMIAWMIVMAATASQGLDRPLVAAAAIGVVILWNVWFTLTPARERLPALWGDLALTVGLVLLSQAIVQPGADTMSFAALYKWTTPGAWGLSRGPGAGVFAGLVLSVVYIASGPIEEVPLSDFSAGQAQQVAYTVVIFLMIGGTMGAVSRMLERSSMQLRTAMDEALRERERAGRLQERERLARQIHDSVLQVLALVHKRGRELARKEWIPPSEMLDLAEMAGRQEEALRSLILQQQDADPNGQASLRAALEALVRTVPEVPITVSAVGPIRMPASTVDEVLAAVRQAVDNVVRHAAATQAFVFAEEDDGTVVVSVRDDGKGFSYDEGTLREAGRFGISRSIKGRIEDLGGTVRVETAPGHGTEVELLIPVVQR